MKSTNKLKRLISLIVTMVISVSILAFATGTTTAEAPNYLSPYPALRVQAHVQNIGWQDPVTEIMGGRDNTGASVVVGTTGRSLRLEALRFGIINRPVGGGGIEINAHLAGTGWTGFKRAIIPNMVEIGTTGQSRAIEAVQIRLTGRLAKYYTIEYRMHLAGTGWTGYSRNGMTCGTTGQSRRAEALEIRIK
ncbi:hydrophobic W protein [Ruminococcus flavefaciens]|uniref:Hydrophobic W protein n=1 Tax=Ruminococcus flavefaciens TaxID=1265 RepID=A0A1H6KX38_RUMFL|nr:hypothetical protein [Ruminococcus flavefaciens]SEH78193.1 hydrophobic W protein [Ruminococcus flavefaciens]